MLSLDFRASYAPKTWHKMYNLAKGAAFGSINHNFLQVGYLRPQNNHPQYGNLYFVGGSNHPGNGLSLALMSAKLTSEHIFEEVGVPQRQRIPSFIRMEKVFEDEIVE
jgi:phytoene dehydrogenase-like protein